MIKNIIKTAMRNLLKRKIFSMINLMGLVIGITSCILILLWVKDEMSYDRFHEGYQNIYRVGEMQKQGEDLFPVGVTPAPLGPALVDNFPEIEDFVRIQSGVHGVMSYEDRVFREKGIILADSSFFNIFGFDLIMGNAEDVLSDPYSIVISDKIARKYFGEEDPIGKVLKYENAVDQKVSGVFAESKENSHMLFDFVVPIKLLEVLEEICKHHGAAIPITLTLC